MPVIDLATTSLRDLNQALHKLAKDTNETLWTISNPGGEHSIAGWCRCPGDDQHWR